MRKLSLPIVALLAMSFTLACAQNAITITTKTVGATEKSVDLAMKTWGEFVRAGKATPAQEAQVKDIYENKYQAALRNAITVLHLTQGSETPIELTQAAADLLALISQLTGKPFIISYNALLEVSYVG